jgi:hypothetical protein
MPYDHDCPCEESEDEKIKPKKLKKVKKFIRHLRRDISF